MVDNIKESCSLAVSGNIIRSICEILINLGLSPIAHPMKPTSLAADTDLDCSPVSPFVSVSISHRDGRLTSPE